MSARAALFALLALLLAAGSAGAAGQANKKAPAVARLQMTQCALKVSGWVCSGCAAATAQRLRKFEGVSEAKADFKTGVVKIVYDGKKTTPEKIVAGFNQNSAGFRAQLLQSKPR